MARKRKRNTNVSNENGDAANDEPTVPTERSSDEPLPKKVSISRSTMFFCVCRHEILFDKHHGFLSPSPRVDWVIMGLFQVWSGNSSYFLMISRVCLQQPYCIVVSRYLVLYSKQWSIRIRIFFLLLSFLWVLSKMCFPANIRSSIWIFND